MKNLVKVTLFILALQQIPHTSFAFDTTNGQYLSEQDLILVLKSVFMRPGLLLPGEGSLIEFDYSAGKFYELGYINLESGQQMVQGPGESYVLAIDIFINRATRFLYLYRAENFQKALFSQAINDYFTQKIKEHYTQTGQYLSFNNYIDAFKFSSLPTEVQQKFVEDILNFIFLEYTLVPPQLKSALLDSVVPVMLTKDFSIKMALTTVIKKSIINDYFLKY